MNLIDAVKSGKRFRRQGHSVWCWVDSGGNLCDRGGVGIHLDSDDILTDDWEVEETYYPVTEEELQRIHFLGGCVFDDTEAKASIDRIKARGPIR